MKRAGTQPGTCLFMEKSSDSPTDFSAGPARAEAGPPAPRLPLTLPPPLPFWPWRILCPGPCATAPSHPFSFPNRPGRHAPSLLPQMVAMTMALLLLLPRLASQSSSRMTAREEVRLPNSTGDLPMTSCMCNAGPLSLPGEDSGSASDEDELSNTVSRRRRTRSWRTRRTRRATMIRRTRG